MFLEQNSVKELKTEMPKIADIQETPNPNAVKFILKEPVSHGTSHSFDSAEKAKTDKLAKSLFNVGARVPVITSNKWLEWKRLQTPMGYKQ